MVARGMIRFASIIELPSGSDAVTKSRLPATISVIAEAEPSLGTHFT